MLEDKKRRKRHQNSKTRLYNSVAPPSNLHRRGPAYGNINILQERSCSTSDDGEAEKSHVDRGASSRVLVVAAAASAASSDVVVGLGVVGLADNLALDLAVAASLLEGVARAADVGGGLSVENTLHVVEGGKRNTKKKSSQWVEMRNGAALVSLTT